MNYYSKKASVIIPCFNCSEVLRFSVPFWISQTYKTFDIVLVDYSSDEPVYNNIMPVAQKYNIKINTSEEKSKNGYDVFDKITILRLENTATFNIPHAINYAVTRSTSDVVVVADPYILPDAHYLEIIMHLVSDNTFARFRNSSSFERTAWYKVNGYQEFVVPVGYKNNDFNTRIQRSGYKEVKISDAFAKYINNDSASIAVADVSIGSLQLYDNYIDMYGIIANYTLSPGGNIPIAELSGKQNSVFVARSFPILPKIELLTKRCCYAGRRDAHTFFSVVPTMVEENLFVDEIVKQSAISTIRTDDTVDSILGNVDKYINAANPIS